MMYFVVVAALGLLLVPLPTAADCLVDRNKNDFFELFNGRRQSIPRFGSCCMHDVCGLQCPQTVEAPGDGYGVALIVAIAISFLVGTLTLFLVKGSVDNFFVAGRSMPLRIVAFTIGAQSIDSNTLLGNVDLSYRLSFWDGAVVPIGLGLSLVLNGIFLASKVHQDNVLTLPDILAKRYGKTVELLASVASTISFIMLLAGNLVGMGVVTGYAWKIGETGAIWLAAAVIWSYTVSGGLFSVAYTDVFQGALGGLGCLATSYWFLMNEDIHAPPPSIGFPGYVYPDSIGEGGICDMYQGVPCLVDNSKCCYNEALWCPNGSLNCDRYDRAAYPEGDMRIYKGQMSDPLALSPFPNSLLYNWATILILGFGNLAALDFQVRCMASNSPQTAVRGCLIGGFVTVLIGVPFTYLGSITRHYYGPDSVYSQFEADTCSIALGLPTCAEWVPDPHAFLKLLTHQAPPFLGAWCMIGLICATMSTADGAILALGTVFSNNIFRQLDVFWPNLVTPENLLLTARVSTLPLTLISTMIAAYYRSSDEQTLNSTGSLLIVAFDIMLATCVVPLFGAFYAKNPSPRAALVSMIGGALTRLVLEFTLPKDGSLLLPYDEIEFLDYGTAASVKFPSFMDANATDFWDPETEQCVQESFSDFTGLDSLAALFVSLSLFVSIQFLEHIKGRPLFSFPGGKGYDKDMTRQADKLEDWTAPVEVLLGILGIVFVVFTVFIVVLSNAVN